MTWRAGRRYPPVILALPVSQPPRVRHSASNSGPAARWIAPSTPPPPSSERLAALTMASTSSVVMSPTATSSCAPRWLTDCNMEDGGIGGDSSLRSRPLGLGLGAQIERAAHSDIVEMGVQEMPCGAASVGMEHAEEVVIGRQLGGGGVGLVPVAQHDAVSIHPAVLAGAEAVRQAAPVDLSRDERDGAVFGEQRGVEGDLVDAIHDVARRGGDFAAFDRIDLHDQ